MLIVKTFSVELVVVARGCVCVCVCVCTHVCEHHIKPRLSLNPSHVLEVLFRQGRNVSGYQCCGAVTRARASVSIKPFIENYYQTISS